MQDYKMAAINVIHDFLTNAAKTDVEIEQLEALDQKFKDTVFNDVVFACLQQKNCAVSGGMTVDYSENENFRQKKEVVLKLLETVMSENAIFSVINASRQLEQLYPNGFFNTSKSIEIFYKSDCEQVFKSAMLKNGFFLKKRDSRKDIFVKDGFIVTAVRLPFDEQGQNLWTNAIENDGAFLREISINDLYVYNLAQAAKHFKGQNSCLLNIINIYFFVNNSELSAKLGDVTETLKKANLYEFNLSVLNLVNSWIGQKKFGNITNNFTDYVLNEKNEKPPVKPKFLKALFSKNPYIISKPLEFCELTKKIGL